MEYTERVDRFQIRDAVYIGPPVKKTKIRFDIVKWHQHNPPLEHVNVISDGKLIADQTITESCYSVGFLVWDEHEQDFRFESVGMRWLEEKTSEAVCDMILKFAEDKRKELCRERED